MQKAFKEHFRQFPTRKRCQALSVLMFLMLGGCGEAPQQSAATSQAGAALAANSYAVRGVDNGWPRLSDGAVALADRLDAANYYLVVDGSGSMGDSGCSDGQPKIGVAKSALYEFIGKLSADANIGVFGFDKRGIGERAALGSTSKELAREAISQMQPGGGTPLSDAVREGYVALTNQAIAQLGYGEYHLVVVTDGEASSGFSPARNVHDIVEGSPVVVHTIGFCIDDRHSLNQPGYTLYRAANDPASLAVGLDAVLAEAPDFSVSSFPENG